MHMVVSEENLTSSVLLEYGVTCFLLCFLWMQTVSLSAEDVGIVIVVYSIIQLRDSGPASLNFFWQGI